MLQIDNVSFSIDHKPILNHLSLEIERKSLHAIIGTNGSGKSTLLRIISRIWKMDEGNIYIDHKNIDNFSRKELSQKVTLVPQDTHLSFPILVKDLVLLGRNPHIKRFHSYTSKDYEIALQAIQEIEIEHLTNKYVTEISGGERQLVWIACALATQAPILLLDEPTASLDIYHTLCIFKILKKLQDKGLTIIVVLHELQEAYSFFDTVSLMEKGHIYTTGKPAEILTEENIKKIFNVHTQFYNIGNHTFLHYSIQ